MTFIERASGDDWEGTMLWGCASVRFRRWLTAATVLWAGLVIAAFVGLAFYSERPSRASVSPEQVGVDVFESIGYQPNDRDTWLLVMAVHPRCPCTAASITELERVIAHCNEPVEVRFLTMIPSDSDASWQGTRHMSRIGRIAGSENVLDADGKIAEQLGMFTSGAVVFCSPQGEVKFTGGITFARGHEGDNPGRHSIVSIVNSGRTFVPSTPTFGCGLSNRGPM